MSDKNPYEPPISTTAPPKAPPDERRLSDDDVKIARQAQMFLRLLGVMLVVEGVGGLIYSAIVFAMLTPPLRALGYQGDAIGWGASSLVSLFAGLYFVLDGRWVLESIFLPPSRGAAFEDDDAEWESTEE